jgi:queuine tRNA-ribosyltransferase
MFKIISKNGNKRLGLLETKSGVIQTPFFMPDATRGFVKSMSNTEVKETNTMAMVVNTYHLFLQPGLQTIKKAGGVHKFMNWHGPLLSDSGGYQVFSLIHKNPKMGKITDKEVVFRSPLDGSIHKLTPKKSIQIQFNLGVDMMVVLDDPTPNDYSREKIEKAMQRTIAWAKICKTEYEKQIKKRKLTGKKKPLIFGVIQGGPYIDLREECARELVKIGFDGYGFGGRHLDAEGNFMEDVLAATVKIIPEKALRFALGIGTPEDIIKCVQMGWDMFDCVIPTREGRHGRLFFWKKQSEFPMTNDQFPNNDQNLKSKNFKQMQNSKSTVKGQELNVENDFYKTIKINNEKYRNDFTPIDKNCDCYTCRNHSMAYLNHLLRTKDPLFFRLASIHNLNFYSQLMKFLQK